MSTASGFASPTTVATVRADGLNLATLWDLNCRRHGETGDYFEHAETAHDDPDGPNGLVVTKSETAAGRGQKVNFRTTTGFYGEGKKGEALFTATADYEKNSFNEYSAYVNCYRNASSANEFTGEQEALRDELENGIPQKLGAWRDRLKTELIDMRVRDTAHADSLFTSNSRGVNGLLSADILDVNNMMMVTGNLSTKGGKPARTGLVKGQPINRWVWGPVMEVTTALKVSDDYQTLLRTTEQGLNHLLDGSIATLDNQIVRPYEVVQHDGNGPIGSARLPMGKLSTALNGAVFTASFSGTTMTVTATASGTIAVGQTVQISTTQGVANVLITVDAGGGTWTIAPTAGTIASGTAVSSLAATAAVVKLGGALNATNDTTKMYAKHFMGYAYTWLASTTGEFLASNPFLGGADFTAAKYLMIVNPPNPPAGYTPNGVGFYKYTTGNDGNLITTTASLASNTSGVAVATFGTGSITTTLMASSGTSAGATFANAHPVDAMVYQCNIKGVPLAFTPVYGAGGILRPMGRYGRSGKRVTEMENGEHLTSTYLSFYAGTQLRKDNLLRTPSVGCIAHAVKFAHHSLPNVTV